jgi:hypothetical protein
VAVKVEHRAKEAALPVRRTAYIVSPQVSSVSIVIEI